MGIRRETDELAAGQRVPKLDGPIEIRGGQPFAVGTISHAIRDRGMAGEGKQLCLSETFKIVPFPATPFDGALVEEPYRVQVIVRLPFAVGDSGAVGIEL